MFSVKVAKYWKESCYVWLVIEFSINDVIRCISLLSTTQTIGIESYSKLFIWSTSINHSISWKSLVQFSDKISIESCSRFVAFCVVADDMIDSKNDLTNWAKYSNGTSLKYTFHLWWSAILFTAKLAYTLRHVLESRLSISRSYLLWSSMMRATENASCEVN